MAEISAAKKQLTINDLETKDDSNLVCFKTAYTAHVYFVFPHLVVRVHQPAIQCGLWKHLNHTWLINPHIRHTVSILFSSAWQSSNITLDKADKTAGPCNYNTPHTGEKRNKWLRGFVMMISLSAWGNYVTMATYFPWVKVQNNEVGSRGCVLGLATYCTEIKTNTYPPILWLHSSHI